MTRGILFLDIDGVLNDHTKLPSGYCGIQFDKVLQLNRILDAVDPQIVVSSAWRYQVTEGAMTLRGFETLLLVHGVKCHNRVLATTQRDPVIAEPDHMDTDTWNRLGLQWRSHQITRWLAANGSACPFVVLDDLPIDVPNLVQTDGSIGLTRADADRAIQILRNPA